MFSYNQPHGKTEGHSITIKEIGADYVIVTIVSMPFDLYLGTNSEEIVTIEGQNVMRIKTSDIQNGAATITFSRLAAAEDGQSVTPTATPNDGRPPWTLLGIVIGAALIITSRPRPQSTLVGVTTCSPPPKIAVSTSAGGSN